MGSLQYIEVRLNKEKICRIISSYLYVLSKKLEIYLHALPCLPLLLVEQELQPT